MQSGMLSLYHQVAPFTGAWIETQEATICVLVIIVAPFTGAWIETFFLEVLRPV